MELKSSRPGNALLFTALVSLALVIVAPFVPAQTPALAIREARLEDLPARTALDDYVKRADSSYSWKQVGEKKQNGATTHILELTSQAWRSPGEVDRPEWHHWLVVSVPAENEWNTALLSIGGGSNRGGPPGGLTGVLDQIAKTEHAVVAELGMVPNQPLRFAGDDHPRYEDNLIAYTWNKFMETGDPTWPCRNAMVKSAVRAMDAVQELVDGIDQFVVAGASKRGWTTWLTGAVDERVVAIVPIVIDILNVIPSMEHHHAAYGFWAPAVGDYERSGVMARRHDPEFLALMKLVDPYYYRHRITMPKYLVNATGDQFFLPDSSHFYFSKLQGESLLRYTPNTDHSLRDSDALSSIEAFFRSILRGGERPAVTWSFTGTDTIRMNVTEGRPPRSARRWQASNPEARDFRLETIGKAWKAASIDPAEGAKTYEARVAIPEQGWRAFFIELTFDLGGPDPLVLTSEVRVVPDTLPFAEN